LADRLRAAIAASGESQVRIAEVANVKSSTISRFMSGEFDLRLATADRLLDYFGFEISGPRATKKRSKGSRQR